MRPPLKNQRVFPPIEHGPLRTWVGVGGSPESVVRAANYDLPLALAIIGGDPKRFRPFVDLYHRSFAQLGRPAKDDCRSLARSCWDTDEQAREEYWRATRPCTTRSAANAAGRRSAAAQFEQEVEQGSLYVGAPETVARKIASTAKALGIVRFDMKYSAGTLPHATMMQSIELYGKKVMPLVREMLAEEKVPAA